MKKWMYVLAVLLAAALCGCAGPMNAQRYLQDLEIDPAALSFSRVLVTSDGSEAALLSDAAQEAVRASLQDFLLPAEEEGTVSAETPDCIRLSAGDLTLCLSPDGKRLTLIHEVEQKDGTFYRQTHFTAQTGLDASIFPTAAPVQDAAALHTLADEIAALDLSLLEKEGQSWDFSPAEAAFPDIVGNAYAHSTEGSLTLGARRINMEGIYAPMLVQEVSCVDTTLLVRVGVSSSEDAGPVTLTPMGEVTEVWFLEAGSVIEVVQPTPAP